MNVQAPDDIEDNEVAVTSLFECQSASVVQGGVVYPSVVYQCRMSDCCFILFQSPGISLDQAAELFTPPHWRVDRADGMLVVQLGDSPVFRIARSSKPHVVIESAEIGKNSPHFDAVSKCDSRFEVMIDDLDAALDEINTLIDVQATLQDATNGFLFSCWNGVLSPPHS